ncbi:SdpI family protein [Staphylococcus massiliensis]|uniref:SdpI family protein n=1 Tax=Staphylococcus massiliensis TaxID=555791 RepID=UPI0002F7B9F6|nr:SdpI family protein [Staphylococcus massiliensis]MCG3401849.1 SdpI family protein [Staphylococcus massiliensis]MCG3413182.1 SdpI family protein [Staphylococcus massiliensis]POA00627.1 hypothetical protein CD133_03905 [Staphylococcus massiliensis CCUG 55927]
MFALANLFKELPPTKPNRWVGYRTPKALKSTKNFIRAQKLSAHFSLRVFKRLSICAVPIFVFDICALIYFSDNVLITSVIIQSVLIFASIGWIIYLVEKYI